MLTGWVRQFSGKTQVAPLDDNQSITFTERLNGRGTWELNVGFGTTTSDALQAVDGPGIVMRFNDEVVFSGSATAIRRQDSDLLTVVGIDDTGLLGDRIVEPNPSTLLATPNEFDSQGFTLLSTVLMNYIDANMGPGAHVDRRVEDFVLGTNPLWGPLGSISGRFEQLDEFIANACHGQDLVFRILQNNNHQIVCDFRIALVATGEVFATEGFNTVKFDSSSKAASVTYVVGAGEGEGTTRVFQRTSAPMTGRFAGRRIETLSDQRSESSTSVIGRKNTELLTDASETVSLKVRLEGHDAFDYVVGDLVKVQIDGVLYSLPIYEAKTTVAPDSLVRELSIGDRDGADQTAGLARLANRSTQRIRTIERI